MRTSTRWIWTAVGIYLMAADPLAAEAPRYPSTRRVDQVDVLHDVQVPDPYRWLEEDVRKSDQVAKWVDDQNQLTFGYLNSIPQRDRIRDRLQRLWDYPKLSNPFRVGGRYFLFKNTGVQNQSVLYTMESLEETPRVLIDPNAWSTDGTVALGGLSISEDGEHAAYAVADAGSDWKIWRVLQVATGRILDDELRWIKFSEPAWTLDGRGFFYSRFAEPKQGEDFQQLNLNHKLYHHRLGTPQSEDVLVYHQPDQPTWTFHPQVTEDGRYLVVTVAKGTDAKHIILYKDLAEPYGMPIELVGQFDHEYALVGNDGPLFYFKTDREAPRGRLIAIDRRQPDPAHWRQIIPQGEDAIESIGMVGNQFVVNSLHDARTRVVLHDTAGKVVREVAFPTIGSANGFGGKRTDTETFYTFGSFATPPTIYRYDLLTGESIVFDRAKVDVDPDAYEVRQVFVSSKDGTKVPMFLTYRKGLVLDGNNPTLLYGYGGFGISLSPGFSVSRLVWMEMGGVFAMVNLRGGGEYGEDWHRAGKGVQKQNVFDDFIAAANWLIEAKYTSPAKLAIQGGSNGGLLVGAVLCQRPDLFGACLPAVGVMDMVRFHKFTAGRFWVDDYGSPDKPDDFKALFAYSPYHNLRPETRYPATLVTTADTDDRVVPGHSFKFAAAMQHAQAGDAPVYIRIEKRAGHGAGKPTAKLIDEVADQWAFLLDNLEMKLPKGFP